MGNPPASSFENLSRQLTGSLLMPGSEGYEQGRQMWNGMFDRHPAAIARCADSADVALAVQFARENDLLLSVKGGGHNSAGNAVCDGGLTIDLSSMRGVHVNEKENTVRVEGGALLGDVDRATQQYGLAVSGGGIISHTGVGGLTLGGGFGWISRRYGLAVDNLIGADLVTASGQVLSVSAKENQDLFWGIRGGGGNFGVVTAFLFKCVNIGTAVYSGLIVKDFADARSYIRFHRDYVRSLPGAMTVWMVIRHAPPLPFLPETVHGKKVLIVPFVWLGEQSEGEKLIAPLQRAVPSLGEAVGMNAWVDWQSGFDGLVEHGARNYWKSHQLKNLSDGCVDAILKFSETMPTEECEVFIPHMEGAPARVNPADTAFAHRKSPFVLNIHTRWRRKDDDSRCLAWARDFHQATRPYADGVYVNFLSDEGQDRVREAYTPLVWQRLVELKQRFGPGNLFRMNQNVKPS